MNGIARTAFAVPFFFLTMLQASFGDETAPCVPAKRPAPILSTHTVPPYPSTAMRNNSQGSTLLDVTVGMDGVPAAVSVAISSGSGALDDVGALFVKTHWRYQPVPADCKPSSMQTHVRLGWRINPPQVDTGLAISAARYPAGAADRFESGDTFLRLKVGADGSVLEGNVAFSSGFADLDETALDILKTTPGIMAGKPGNHIVLARWTLPEPQKDNVEIVSITGTIIYGSLH